jgi:toxin CcdB
MKRFDVCPASGAGVAGRGRLVVVLQHEHLSDLGTLVVAPLFASTAPESIQRLRPLVHVGDRDYVVAIDRLASLPARQLGAAVANLEGSRYELVNALDFLFAGF